MEQISKFLAPRIPLHVVGKAFIARRACPIKPQPFPILSRSCPIFSVRRIMSAPNSQCVIGMEGLL